MEALYGVFSRHPEKNVKSRSTRRLDSGNQFLDANLEDMNKNRLETPGANAYSKDLTGGKPEAMPIQLRE
jgi:hypothetical protein